MAIVLGKKEKKLLIIVGVVAACALIAPGVLGKHTYQYQSEQQQLKSSLEKKQVKIKQDLDGIEDQKEILRQYISRYKSLAESNVIEPPDTVEVVKAMKRIRDDRKLLATSFTFEDAVLLPPDRSTYTTGSSVSVEVHPMILEMGMLHDMDMFMFLESLSGIVPTLAFPVACSMRSLNNEFSIETQENLQATCQVNWYAVSDPERNVVSEENEETASAGN